MGGLGKLNEWSRSRTILSYPPDACFCSVLWAVDSVVLPVFMLPGSSTFGSGVLNMGCSCANSSNRLFVTGAGTYLWNKKLPDLKSVWLLPAYEVRREGNVFSLSVCSSGGRERGTPVSCPRSLMRGERECRGGRKLQGVPQSGPGQGNPTTPLASSLHSSPTGTRAGVPPPSPHPPSRHAMDRICTNPIVLDLLFR